MEENTELNEAAVLQESAPDIFPEYKKTAYKVGTYVAVISGMRIPAAFAINALYKYGTDVLSPDLLYIFNILLSMTFLQILPSVIGAAMFGLFKGGKIKEMYRKPKSFTKAVGNFPPIYGLGQMVNILTILITLLVTNQSNLNDNFNPLTQLTPPGMKSAWVLFLFVAILGPVFEEFVFRGVLLDALKPYGNRLAIFFTGIFFGLFHGNFSQCFFAAVIGIALGYIADVTDSVLPTTVIHILINTIGATILVFLSTNSVQEYLLSGGNEDIPDGDMIVIVCFCVFSITALLLAVVGMITAVMKLRRARKYKVPRVYTEISGGKKAKTLLLTVPVIIAAILLIDTFAGFSAGLINSLFI